MLQTVRVLALILISTSLLLAQTTQDPKAAEATEELQKEAVGFLRESLSDVNSMRSLENRISFTAEMAGLMWYHDEREARAMYTAVIADYRDLIAKYDAQMNALGLPAEDSDPDTHFPSFLMEPTDRLRIQRRFQTAMAVGQQMAMSLAEHDAELAYNFYYDSLAAVSNPQFRKQLDSGNSYFESQLLTQIVAKNAGKAVQLASRGLGKGVTSQHVELLKKIHAKDPEKGAEFASAILSRLKTDKVGSKDFYAAGSLLEFGDETLEASRKPGGKPPAFKQADLRDLAELLAQGLLNRRESEDSSPIAYLSTIQKYAPGRAAQINARLKRNAVASASNLRRYSNANVNVDFGVEDISLGTNSNTSVAAYERQAREREAREKAEGKIYQDIQEFGKKQLSKVDRAKFVAQTRKILGQNQSREKKLTGLSLLAAQVSGLGDKELAAEIMKDAAELVAPTPKNYRDFMMSWILASAYANVEPDKAFVLLEETIGRANNTLEAFVKVGEFMDVAEEMIQDGEVQVGAFGGQMVRGLTRELGMADSTIQQLAKADFGKLKNVANRFERVEVRVLARMMVLRAVLNPQGPEVVQPDYMGPVVIEPGEEPSDN
jgi:hypothetical protein